MRRLAKLAVLTGLLSMPLVAQDVAPNIAAQQEFNEILKLGDVEKAKDFVKSKAEAAPKSDDVLNLKQRLASFLLQKGENKAAEDQIKEVVAIRLEQIDRPGATSQLVNVLSLSHSILTRAGNTEEAANLIEKAMKELSDKAKGERVTPYHQALTQVIRLKAQRLSLSGKTDEAKAMLEASVAEAEKLFASDSESIEAGLNVVTAYQCLLMELEGEQQKDAFLKMQSFVDVQMKAKPDNVTLLASYVQSVNLYANRIVRDDPIYVEKLLSDVRVRLQTAREANESSAKYVDNLSKILDRVASTAESAKKLFELIGQPAPKIDAEHWVHAEATTQEELKGKVVLLDFWAVWCGPCIATFPHLKHLDHEYGPQGLKILGVTRKYNYSWNEDTKKASKSEGEVSIEDELVMLDKFIASHELTHGTIVTPEDSNMQKEYGVSGIPHAVLIDKKGNVRLIKVGSGDKNAADIEAEIQKLLAE